MELVPVIGLEVHAQLNTKTKIFCSCSTRFGVSPNENTCPVCLGLPGALPVLNQKALELALRAALALDCRILPASTFARKNYFYPDLPKGYQISQYDQPLAVDGHLEVNGRIIRIKRVHMEEDAGKLLHDMEDASYVDLNRAGVPLIEIVSEPDLETPEEAHFYLKQLKAILQFCEVSEANMEEGNLRCDANISVRQIGGKPGTRVEIKNLNSFRNVMKALSYEFDRQKEVIQSGGQVAQETRLFQADVNKTESMRSKEEAEDYRYFPDPDLLPLNPDASYVMSLRKSLPELPQAKKERFQKQYRLTPGEAEILTEEKSLAQFYEDIAASSGDPKQSANWIIRDLLEKMNMENKTISQLRIGPAHLAGLIRLLAEKTINNAQGRQIFDEMWKSGKMPETIVTEKGMRQVSDAASITPLIEEVFHENPDLVARYRAGETKLQGVLVGLVIKKSSGKANPSIVNKLIKERI